MYDVIIDVDGVLIDLHESLKHRFASLGYNYDVNNVYTYDFNRYLPDEYMFRQLPPRSMIFELFEDADIYKEAPVDWDSIMLIRHYAEQGFRFLVYTLSANMDVHLAKQAMFLHWFPFTPNVRFLSLVDNGDYKPVLSTKIVIEDCHINLMDYGPFVHKLLVDAPYNRAEYNASYHRLFEDPFFLRCKNTSSAINLAVSRITSGKYRFI